MVRKRDSGSGAESDGRIGTYGDAQWLSFVPAVKREGVLCLLPEGARRAAFSFTVCRDGTVDGADPLPVVFWCVEETVSTGWHESGLPFPFL